MNKKLLRTAAAVAVTAVAAAAAIAFTPFGEFLQSSLIQSLYNEVDSGLYIGQERTENNAKNLRAQQGVTLRSEPVREGSTDFINVYVTAHTDNANLRADALKAVVEYDKSKLTLENITGGALSAVSVSGSIDQDFSQVVKDASGNETGMLYVGLNKSTEFTKPSESVLKIKFKALTGMQFADVNVKTLRMYKREDLLDAAKPTLYLNKGETANTTAEKLTVTLGGINIAASETATADGGKVRTETFKDPTGETLKTVVTTYNSQGKITKIVTTMANGDTETKDYVYNTDGSYSLTTTTKIGTATTTSTIQYDKVGLVKSTSGNANTNTATGTTLTNANGNLNRNTNGVISATTTGNTNTNSAVTTTPATTTGTTCTPSANERFNDTIGHWSADVVEQARLKCIISGKALGRFAPDEPVTRAELTKIAVEAFKVSQSQTGSLGLVDVSDSEWYANYVRAAKLAGIVSGYSDGTFKPNNEINRAEALKIILEAGVKTRGQQLGLNVDGRFSSWLNQNPTFTYVRFPDVKIADWFGKYVLSGFERGVVRGYNDRGTDVFRPAQPVTRAEAVKMIMSIVQ